MLSACVRPKGAREQHKSSLVAQGLVTPMEKVT